MRLASWNPWAPWAPWPVVDSIDNYTTLCYGLLLQVHIPQARGNYFLPLLTNFLHATLAQLSAEIAAYQAGIQHIARANTAAICF